MRTAFNEERPRPRHILILSFVFLFFFTGCATIRQPTVDLSAEIGKRINEMQELHLLAINQYFDMEVTKVVDFLENKWEPTFLKNFWAISGIEQMLQNVQHFDPDRTALEEALSGYLLDPSEAEQAIGKLALRINDSRKTEKIVVRSLLSDYVEDDQLEAATLHITSLLGTDSAAQLVLEFAEAAHDQMNEQRMLMLGPIEQLRSEAVAELTVAYADIIRGQSTLTGRLQAAAKLTEEKDRALQAMGVKDFADGLKQKLGNVSVAVDKALNKVDSMIPGIENMEEGEIINALPGAVFSEEMGRLLSPGTSDSDNQ